MALKYNTTRFKIAVLVLISVITPTCHAMDQITKAAQRFDATQDYYHNKISIGGAFVTVTSYFNLTEHAKVLDNALRYDHAHAGQHDFRPLETMYCRLARQSQPFYVRHRGSIGLTVGAMAASAYFNYRQQSQHSK
jgi:hypothetical protein